MLTMGQGMFMDPKTGSCLSQIWKEDAAMAPWPCWTEQAWDQETAGSRSPRQRVKGTGVRGVDAARTLCKELTTWGLILR